MIFLLELTLHPAVGNVVRVLDLDANDAALLADGKHARDRRTRDPEHLADLLLPEPILIVETAAFKDEAHIVNDFLHRDPLS